MRQPEIINKMGDDAAKRRRGYAALMRGPGPALQSAPTTTGTLGG